MSVVNAAMMSNTLYTYYSLYIVLLILIHLYIDITHSATSCLFY
jgi:hypothetical protein